MIAVATTYHRRQLALSRDGIFRLVRYRTHRRNRRVVVKGVGGANVITPSGGLLVLAARAAHYLTSWKLGGWRKASGGRTVEGRDTIKGGKARRIRCRPLENDRPCHYVSPRARAIVLARVCASILRASIHVHRHT